MPTRLAGWLLVLSFAFLAGCPSPTPVAPPKTLIEWFKLKEADAIFSDGAIDMESVEQEGEDTIIYETEGGRKWKVTFEKIGDAEWKRTPGEDPVEITAMD